MTLDARDLIILAYFEGNPGSVKPLFSKVCRSTAYPRMKKLKAGGCLGMKGRKWVLLPLGREELGAARAVPQPRFPEPTILEAVPHIALGPTPVHRSVLVLICAAIVARKHRICESHHPTFLLFGPKLTWKTWLAMVACWIAGIDPDKYVLNMASETPGSLIVRRDASGKIVTRRAAVSQPVIGLDELLRATGEVLRMFKVLSSGEIKTSFENEILEILCVPVATMNPKRDHPGASLTDRLQLDEGTLRRSIPVDLGAVALPSEVLTEGDSRLARAQALGPAGFPAPRDPDWLPATEVQRYLEKAFDSPARSADVDFTMVAMLCTALTAWLSRRDALHLGVKCYLEAVETLGWLKSDWRKILPPTGTVDALGGQAAAREVRPDSPGKPNPVDHTAKLRTMLATCRQLRITAEEGAGLLARVERLGIDKLAALESLDADLAENALDLNRLGEILSLGGNLADTLHGSKARAVELLRRLLETARDVFPDRLSVDEFSAALGAVSNSAADVGRLREAARALKLEISDLADRREEAAARTQAQQAKLEKYRAARKQTRHELARLQKVVGDLRAKSIRRSRLVAIAEELLNLFKGELNPFGPFAKELASFLRARREGRRLGRIVTLSDAAKWEIHSLFFSKLSDGYVPQAKVEEFKQEARRAAEEKLRRDLTILLGVLSDPQKTIVEKRDAIDAAIRDLG